MTIKEVAVYVKTTRGICIQNHLGNSEKEKESQIRKNRTSRMRRGLRMQKKL